MKENVTVFTKLAIFLLFNLEGFWQFFKPNILKSSSRNSKLLLLPCREYLVLGTFFVFFVFAFLSNLEFFEIILFVSFFSTHFTNLYIFVSGLIDT